MRRKPKKESMVNMPLVNPNAAGIDVGDSIHAVAVPEGRDELREMTLDQSEFLGDDFLSIDIGQPEQEELYVGHSPELRPESFDLRVE